MEAPDLMADLVRLLSLADHNTRVVLLGAAILGWTAGIMGTYMMLRRRALVSDVVSHAALPGIVIAFMITAGGAGEGKQLPALLLGALVSGLLGMACVQLIRRYSTIKEDAALGIILSVFFGLGVALMGIAQRMKTGSAAGLESFIYGKTASMLVSDAQLMAVSALVVGVVCLLFFKEFRLLCFDPGFARAQRWPVQWLDALLILLVVAVTVIGLQAVGLILMLALLIIPPAAARFWTDRLTPLLFLSSGIGAVGAVTGAGMSSVYPRMPAGAVMVLVCSSLFIISMFFGTHRGVIRSWINQSRLARRMVRQHLLRDVFECLEATQPETAAAPDADHALINGHTLASFHRWTEPSLLSHLKQAAADGDVEIGGWPVVRLTAQGLQRARHVARNHRLWEWYLIQHADIAASHVDRDADEIEHVLGHDMVAELERTLAARFSSPNVPGSPHPIIIPIQVPDPESRS